MLFHEQKTFSNFQEIVKMQWKVTQEYKKLTYQKTKYRIYCQYQKKKNTSFNWQCIKHQLHEFTTMMKSRDKRKRTKTIANYEKYKMKWNNKNHKKNERNKYEHCWSLRINSVQWNENVRTQNYVRNELTTMTQLENWLKMKKSHNEKL